MIGSNERRRPPGSGRRGKKQRIAVIGGGIVGLAHAWAAAKRGHQVHLFERHEYAQSASIRNFGMVWPIGQPNGPDHRAALRSRALWLEMLRDAELWHDPCGSLHLAYEQDELDVLEEFAQIGPPLGYDCSVFTAEEVAARSPAAQRKGLLGGLWSGTEMLRRSAPDHFADAQMARKKIPRAASFRQSDRARVAAVGDGLGR